MPPEQPPTGADLLQDYQRARTLITGGLGLIGSALARRLLDLGASVTIVDAHMQDSSANIRNIEPIRQQLRLELVDVRSADELRPLLTGNDYLFNLAGQSGHIASMTDPLADLDINCRAQLSLLEACRQANPEMTIVFASTRQIYGRPNYLPVDERHPLSPVDVNGIDKMAGDAFHRLYHSAFGLKTCALRLTNTYGPGMRIKDDRQNFVGIWLRNLIEGRPIEVWGGAQKRDFTYVDDAADAFLLAAACPSTLGRAFNIGGDRPISLHDFATLLVSVNGGGDLAVRPFPETRKPIDIGDYYTNDELFRRTTGWEPRITLEDGIARTIAYFRSNLQHYV